MPFKNVIQLDSLTLEKDHSGEYRVATAPISSELGTWLLGFHLEVLEPHSFSCPYHYHHAEEELFLVLEGHATLRQREGYRHVGPGDLIFCALGPDHAHQFYNHTDEPFRFLALSNQAQWDLCQYPDSDKLNVRGLAKVYQVEAAVDYYQGETDPRAAWPSEVLGGKLPSP